MTGQSQDDLQTTLYEFIHASTWTESRWILAMHPELLTDEADSLLSRAKSSAREIGMTHDAEVAHTHQRLLRLSRKIGPKAAFVEVTGNYFPPLSPELVELHDTAAKADASFRDTGDIKQLHVAIDALEAGIRKHSAELERAPLETIEFMYAPTMGLRLHSFTVTGQAEDLEAALDYWARLLDRSSGSVDDLSALSSGVGGSVLFTAHFAGYRTLQAAVQALEHAVSTRQPGADRDAYARNLEYARSLLAER
jgi:hypothetical protein